MPLEELTRIATERGCVVLGYPETLWQSWNITNQLEELEAMNIGQFLILQKLSLSIEDIEAWTTPLNENKEMTEALHAYEAPIISQKKKKSC